MTSPPQIKFKGQVSFVSPVQNASMGVLKGLTLVMQTIFMPSPSLTVDLTSVNDKLEKLIDSSTLTNQNLNSLVGAITSLVESQKKYVFFSSSH